MQSRRISDLEEGVSSVTVAESLSPRAFYYVVCTFKMAIGDGK